MRNLDFTVFFEGRLTKDAIVVEKENTTSFIFTLAIDDGFKSKETGEWVDKTKFKQFIISCKNISNARLEFLKNKLLIKGYKVKGTAQMGEPQLCLDKTTKKPLKDKKGSYVINQIFFVEDIKLVAKPNGNPVPLDKAQPTIKDEDDLPF